MSGFGRYLAAALAARFASEGMGMAVVLLALERTGDAAYGAFVLTAWLAPHVLAAPLAGAAAARARSPRLFHVGALGSRRRWRPSPCCWVGPPRRRCSRWRCSAAPAGRW
ncbi:hypothetical protein [Streptomyces sp. NPDC048272]|uniref:hypothetical protein n=1 Tax=Streptomyces sp. NPDC048272 TaxID=3154616 RepID=UPI00341B674D